MNELIFFLQVFAIISAVVVGFKMGKEALIAIISVLCIFGNLFVLKQITMFGLHVVATDAFPVGAIIGLNLLQEFYSEKLVKKAISICFFCMIFYIIISKIHLIYIPSTFDVSSGHYHALLKHMPRITLTSIFVTLSIMQINRILYGFLQRKFQNKYFLTRFISTIFISQLLDSTLFAFIALYGLIPNLLHIIIISTIIKTFTAILAVPAIAYIKARSKKTTKD